MRVLFAVWPAPAHLYPSLPLAWAFQAAGHEVAFASHPELAEAITGTGQTAVVLGDRDTMPTLDMATIVQYGLSEQAHNEVIAALTTDPAYEEQAQMFTAYLITAMDMFHKLPEAAGDRCPGVDDLVDFARGWRADLVIWDPCWPSAAVAARACGAAQVRLLWGPDYCGWATKRLSEAAAAGPAPENPLAALMRPVAHRYGQEVDQELLLGQWSLDLTPAPMQIPTDAHLVPLRRIPFTGSTSVPDWLYPRPDRPRVALTLGVSTRNIGGPEPVVKDLLAAVADLDIEVVATLNDDQVADYVIPENVRVVEYIPLDLLLPTCAAIVHHGGGGTLASAVAQRIPQLIEVSNLEATDYAQYITDFRAGITLNHEVQTPQEMGKLLSRVLDESSFTEGAERLYQHWLTLPSPSDLVPRLVDLVAATKP